MPRIKDLTKKTGNLSSADQFVSDNGTAVTKIDYTALARAIIEQYNGSTLAGSAQSVQAALNSLNSNLSGVKWASSDGSQITKDITSYVDELPFGFYARWSTLSQSGTVGAPSAHSYFYLISKVAAGTAIIYATRMTEYINENLYIKEKYGGSGWNSQWKVLPTRAEMDAVNSKIKYVSKTITVPAGSSSSPSTVDIDFSDDITSGSLYGLLASAGATPIPYVSNSGQVQTWIRSVGAKTARIYETGSGYTSRDWYFVLFIK